MDAARFNIYWFLSLLAPAVIMFGATYFQRRWVLVAGILVSLSTTYFLSNTAVQEKWRVRFESAKTERELESASADGANVVFTAFFFAPFEAVTYTSLWSVVGWRAWRRSKMKANPNET